MSWKCDNCDTYNEDGDAVCYVCGQPRSEKSIREAARVAAEARRALADERINKTLTAAAKTLRIAGIALGVFATVILIIIMLIKGRLGDIGTSAVYAAKRAWAAVAAAFGDNLPAAAGMTWNGALKNTASVVPVAVKSAAASAVEFVRGVLPAVAGTAWNSIKTCFEYVLKPLAETVVLSVGAFAAVFSDLAAEIKTSSGRIFRVGRDVFNSAAGHFNK